MGERARRNASDGHLFPAESTNSIPAQGEASMISFNELLARIVDAIISVITTVVGDFLLGDILRGFFFPFLGV